MAERQTVVIAGASGVIGEAAIRHFAGRGWRVVGLSRRRPTISDDVAFEHLPVDLLDDEACRAAVAKIGGCSHLVYAALYEKPGLVAGWRDAEQMRINLAMLSNLLGPLSQKGLEHVSLLQGTKAYGVHLRPFAVPAKESWPRHPHDNFYWLQEDHVLQASQRHGFGFTIFRPQIVFGDAVGVAMNLIPVLGVYAAICREAGRPLSYPGGPSYLLEATDADIMAQALVWAASEPAAHGETFNITNGDVFAWPNIWPAIADAFELETGEPSPLRLAAYLPENEALWDAAVQRHGLARNSLSAMVGQSHHYADFCMATGAREPVAPVVVSTIKIRQAGFAACIDTEAMFTRQISTLRARRLVP